MSPSVPDCIPRCPGILMHLVSPTHQRVSCAMAPRQHVEAVTCHQIDLLRFWEGRCSPVSPCARRVCPTAFQGAQASSAPCCTDSSTRCMCCGSQAAYQSRYLSSNRPFEVLGGDMFASVLLCPPSVPDCISRCKGPGLRLTVTPHLVAPTHQRGATCNNSQAACQRRYFFNSKIRLKFDGEKYVFNESVALVPRFKFTE
jgi:hypothetical protein